MARKDNAKKTVKVAAKGRYPKHRSSRKSKPVLSQRSGRKSGKKRMIGCDRLKPEEWYRDGKEHFELDDIRRAKTCLEGFMIDGRLLVNMAVKERKKVGVQKSKRLFESAEEWFGKMHFWNKTCSEWIERHQGNAKSKQDIEWIKTQLSNGYRIWGRTIAYLAREILNGVENCGEDEKGKEERRSREDEAKRLFGLSIDKYNEAEKIGGWRKDTLFYDKGVACYRKYMLSRDCVDLNAAEESFKKSGNDVMGLFVNLDKDAAGPMSEEKFLYGLLDNWKTTESRYFKETVGDVGTELEELYKKIYIQSIYIISRLKLEGIFETDVVHYTRREFAQDMLFGSGTFRLSDTVGAEDEEEGKILMDFLFDGLEPVERATKAFGAFTGCFTFGRNSLTHFKLFGVKDLPDGSGLSLVFRRSFFGGTDGIEPDLKEENKNAKEGRKGLYRCAYFSPEEKKIIAVGQVEREFSNWDDETYKIYVEEREEQVKHINVKLDSLKLTINDNKAKLDRGVVERLLLKLSYLIKSVSYRNEQECRIVQICHLANERGRLKEDDDFGLYMPYEPKVSEHVAMICFGPNMEWKGKFEGFLKYKGLDIPCIRSRNIIGKKN